MKNTKSSWFAVLGLSLSSAVFSAGSTPLDVGKSTLTAAFRQMGVSVDGSFKKFSGSISFDAAKPAEAQATIDIDTASFDIGDEEYNAEVRKKEWLDSKAHPKASFVSTSLKAIAADKYEAAGTLSLKGKTQVLKLPFTRKLDGASQIFEGSIPISRAYFAIGDAGWNEVLEDTVQVKFRIVVPKT